MAIEAVCLSEQETGGTIWSFPLGTYDDYNSLLTVFNHSPHFQDLSRRYHDYFDGTVEDNQAYEMLRIIRSNLSSWIHQWKKEGSQGQRVYGMSSEEIPAKDREILSKGIERSSLYCKSHHTRARWELTPEAEDNASFLNAVVAALRRDRPTLVQ